MIGRTVLVFIVVCYFSYIVYPLIWIIGNILVV